MRPFFKLASLLIGLAFAGTMIQGESQTLFDFTTMNNVSDWIESSDTVRSVGMSKAVLALQVTQEFQRAVFFTLLNPQTNGAAFAGVRVPTTLNLSSHENITLSCRAQGDNKYYKVVLRHRGMSVNDISYEQVFEMPLSNVTDSFSTISLGLSSFEPYFRGVLQNNTDPLDTANITMFGLQMFGGVFKNFKQSGVSSLEIQTITAT